MKNITVSVADETYRAARIWAAENNTSISAAVEYMLENIRSILSVRKPPRRPRRNNRYAVPPELASRVSCEELMWLVNQPGSKLSIRTSREPVEFHQL
jgi:hypothetical protein